MVSSLAEKESDKHFLPVIGLLYTVKSQPIAWKRFETRVVFKKWAPDTARQKYSTEKNICRKNPDNFKS
jgi:hypothetical protein